MSITTTAPHAVSAEIEAGLLDLRRMIGTEHASASIVYGHGTPGIWLSANWPNDDYTVGRTEPRATFAEMVIEARALIRAWRVTRRNDMIRRLALAIIEITDEHTRCTAALLRAKGFSDPDITEFQGAACQRASEMCANAPFSVEG